MTAPAEVTQDAIAVSLAQALALANKRAGEMGVDATQSLISITQHEKDDAVVWRINYGPRNYVGQRGGDLIIDVAESGIQQVRRGQ